MNIFYLDQDIQTCAKYHCDKHVVKMITEYAQLLSNVYYYTNELDMIRQKNITIFKLTHSNHPCAKWVRESLDNWLWLKDLGLALYQEYQHRYNNKIHKSGEIIKQLPMPNLSSKGITKRPQAMPLQYQHLDTIEAYRSYYIGDKQHVLQYKNRETPKWIRR